MDPNVLVKASIEVSLQKSGETKSWSRRRCFISPASKDLLGEDLNQEDPRGSALDLRPMQKLNGPRDNFDDLENLFVIIFDDSNELSSILLA